MVEERGKDRGVKPPRFILVRISARRYAVAEHHATTNYSALAGGAGFENYNLVSKPLSFREACGRIGQLTK